MRIILFYQHKVRELKACRSLVSYLEEKFHHLNIEVNLYQIDFEWDLAKSWAEHHGIDVVVMPWLYSRSNYIILYPFLRVNPDLRVINLHHEQISNEAYERLLLPDGENSKNGCFHFTWGSFFANKLKNCGVKQELIFETGNIRLDDILKGNHCGSKKKIGQEFGLDTNKKWILYAENRGWVYKATQAFEEEYLHNGVSRESYLKNKQVCTKSLELTYQQFFDLPESFFEDYELIYRPHPGTRTPIQHDKIKVISDYSIAVWLKCIDCLIVWDSTTAYEAEIAGVPVLRHEPIEHPRDLLIYGMEEFPVIREICQIPEVLAQYYTFSRKRIYEAYYGKVDGRSIQRCAETIVRCAHDPIKLNTTLVLTKEDKKELRRRVAFDKVSRLLNKFGLIKKFHWPRSAYAQLNDIP